MIISFVSILIYILFKLALQAAELSLLPTHSKIKKVTYVLAQNRPLRKWVSLNGESVTVKMFQSPGHVPPPHPGSLSAWAWGQHWADAAGGFWGELLQAVLLGGLNGGCPSPGTGLFLPSQGPLDAEPDSNPQPCPRRSLVSGAAPQLSHSLAKLVGQPWLSVPGSSLLTGYSSMTAWYWLGLFQWIQAFPPPHEHTLCTHMFPWNALLLLFLFPRPPRKMHWITALERARESKESFSFPNYSAIFPTTFLAYVLFSSSKLSKD